MIAQIKEDLLKYLADKYYNYEWKETTGNNNFNKKLPEEYKISCFSLGNFRRLSSDVMIVQVKSVAGDRSAMGGQLGTVNFASNITINIMIEKVTNPSTATMMSDTYVETIYNELQRFIYNHKNNFTPVNPKISIQKYFSYEGDANYNSINKVIISADLTFDYKAQNLTLEEYN